MTGYILIRLAEKLRPLRFYRGVIFIIAGVGSIIEWLRGEPATFGRPLLIQITEEPWRTLETLFFVALGIWGVKMIIDTASKIKRDKKLAENL